MAVVNYPNIEETKMSLYQMYPAQAVVTMEYTGRQRVTNAGGPPLWAGSITFRGFEEDELVEIADMHAFLLGLRGGVNTFRIPVYNSGFSRRAGTLASGALTVSTAAIAGDFVNVTVTGATTGISKGDYVTIGDRLYLVVASLASSIMSLTPNFAPATGASIEYLAPTLHARATGNLPQYVNAGNGIISPFQINFVENI